MNITLTRELEESIGDILAEPLNNTDENTNNIVKYIAIKPMKYYSLTGNKKYIVSKKKSAYKKSIKDNKMLNKILFGTSIKTKASYEAIDIFKDRMNNHNNCNSNNKTTIHNNSLINIFNKRVNLYQECVFKRIMNYLSRFIPTKKKLFKLLLVAFNT